MMYSVTAHADEGRLEPQISKCLVMATGTPHIRGFEADFQVVLSKAGKVETITVMLGMLIHRALL
ncbi:hypothetical protein X759_36265 [Mesorhizobium sp. LSHC420B00]|nr:hypothetical protein X772_35195 [Mesorhizobium sp. LSJC280B00]ESX59563.1 hypothetical protein X759_36265 [Mesorhizobium sp. LSHC420B00]